MLKKIVLPLILIFISLSCGDVDNDDTAEEVPCTELAGTWIVSQISCSGTDVTFPYQTMTFDSETQITSLIGGADCQRSYQATATHAVPILSTVGFGNFSCLVNASDAPSCSGTDISCDNTSAAENLTSSFQVCVLRNKSSLFLSRTATTEDISNGVSACTTPGEVEELLLEEQTAGLATLSISDGAIFDFGSTNVGSPVYKQFIVTNSGDSTAMAVATSSLSSPFIYAGGAYPGQNGTDLIGDCQTEILPGSCKIIVEFKPSTAGTFDRTLTLSYDNGAEIQETSRALTGEGVN